MFVVSGGKGIGKTKLLLEKVKEEDAILVCKDTFYMRERAYSYGIVGINIMSYEDFCRLDDIKEPVYIHNLNEYLKYCCPTVAGYSICMESN